LTITGLILFDKVYIELPIDSSIKSFCENQKVTREELLELSRTGKVTFLLTQPSFRYDINFLDEIFRCRPSSIISRRALSALILCDLVEINNNYVVKKFELYDAINELSIVLSEATGQDYEHIYNLLTWPTKALRRSFEVMLWGSTKRVAAFGINKIFNFPANNEKSSALDLEFTVNSEKVHISSALNSFYFPFYNDNKYSNRPFTSTMRNTLNLYKNSTEDQLKNYIKMRQSLTTEDPTLLPIDLIEINEFYSVFEIEQISKQFYTGKNFQSIISYLASLSHDKRQEKVVEYNRLIQEEVIRNKRTRAAIDFGITAGIDTAGIFVPFLGSGIKVLDYTTKKFNLQNQKHLEKIRESFSLINENNISDKKIISFLSKISPVARLKRNY